jgi:HSP20 family molecular chaperone IbpA
LSERWWRRRRRLDPWFGDVFEDADKMERMMDSMIRQAFGSPVEREKARRRYVQINEEYEPLVDLFVDETNVVIVAELPGMDKESIEVDATEDKVAITVDSPRNKFCRELPLPARVDPKSSVASYRNGVLEVRLKKIVERRLFIR